jgi:hypothetical protein
MLFMATQLVFKEMYKIFDNTKRKKRKCKKNFFNISDEKYHSNKFYHLIKNIHMKPFPVFKSAKEAFRSKTI